MKPTEKRQGRNWKARYLTIERFNQFIANDFRHLNWKVNLLLGLVLAVLGAVLAKFITG